MKTLNPKFHTILTSFFLILQIFCNSNVQAQCSIDYVEVCDFGGTYTNWTDMDVIGSCLDNSNSNEGAYVVFNVVVGGELNVAVEGLPNVNNFMDVAVYRIPNGNNPCDSPVEISCNFASSNSDCSSFGGGLGCASNVAGPTVSAGDRVMVLVHDYNNVYSSFRVSVGLGLGKAILGSPNVDLQPTGPLQEFDPPTATNTGPNHSGGGEWSASCGSCIDATTGLFNPTTAGAGTHTVTYSHYNLGNPCFNTGTSTVTVNGAPDFTSPDAVDFEENGTGVVIDVQSTDDTNAEFLGLTYSLIASNDSGLFTIDADDGEIRFVNSPDFESPIDGNIDNDYLVEVEVCDNGGGCSLQLITVSVTNENEMPDITSGGGNPTQSITLLEEIETTVTTITATDPDAGDVLTYSISGGVDELDFSIDSATGELVFNLPPDFEMPIDDDTNNEYVVEVTVTDAGGLTDVQTISITITDGNDPPEITSDGGNATASLTVDENQNSVTTVTATDINAGDTQTFSIGGGNDNALFAIDSVTGVLTFVGVVDYESPLDADMDNIYEVEVIVTDNDGLMDVQLISVTINDLDEDGDGFTAGNGETDDSDPCVPDNSIGICCEAIAPSVSKD